MKILAQIAFIFLVSNYAFSQLTITDTTYIYAKDRVIYSEDIVTFKDPKSRMLLRNESQLLQGNINAANQGKGLLSVYQDGNVGAHEYNYWCAPVGNTTLSTTNNNFGIPLLYDINNTLQSTQATFVHNSNYNGTASPLNIEPYWIWKFISSDEYAEWIHVEDNFTVNPGEGFTMKGTEGTSSNNPGGNQLYDFRGKPNNGTISTVILENQFTLVGNPYPSALDALKYIHDPENKLILNGTLYYWEQDLTVNSHYLEDYDGGYATYTISSDGSIETYVPAVFYKYNGDGTINSNGNGVPSGNVPNRYIPIGQGFMVEGAENGVAKSKNSHRAYVKESNVESNFFRTLIPSYENTQSVSDWSRLRFNITFNDNYTRQLVQTFTSIATSSFDYGLENINNELLPNDGYWSDDEFNYLAQANNFNVEMSIPININLETESEISINLVSELNFLEDTPVFILDNETGTYTNLKDEIYTINLDSGSYTNRFSIVFKDNSALSITENEINNTIKFYHNNNDNKLVIYNPKQSFIKELKVYDILGREVVFMSLKSNNLNYSFSTESWASGTYIAQVVLNQNRKVSLKFVTN